MANHKLPTEGARVPKPQGYVDAGWSRAMHQRRLRFEPIHATDVAKARFHAERREAPALAEGRASEGLTSPTRAAGPGPTFATPRG